VHDNHTDSSLAPVAVVPVAQALKFIRQHSHFDLNTSTSRAVDTSCHNIKEKESLLEVNESAAISHHVHHLLWTVRK
jgi:hypothetical protein